MMHHFIEVLEGRVQEMEWPLESSFTDWRRDRRITAHLHTFIPLFCRVDRVVLIAVGNKKLTFWVLTLLKAKDDLRTWKVIASGLATKAESRLDRTFSPLSSEKDTKSVFSSPRT